MNPLLLAAAPALVSEVGQGVRQYLEHRRQRAASDQAARIAALEEKVAALAKIAQGVKP